MAHDELVVADPELPGQPCSVCPLEVRELMATAFRLVANLDAVRGGASNLSHVWASVERVRLALAGLEHANRAHDEVHRS